MSVLQRIAHFQNRRDEAPNQELARELAASKDKTGIREIAGNLWNKDKNIQADCIKVLYEIGYMDPALIGEYVEDFVKLLRSRNNRLVWGGMIALAQAAKTNPDVVYKHVEEIKKAKEAGSVITVDNAVATLSQVAAANPKYSAAIFPYLLDHLKTCRPKEVAQHSEKTLPAVTASNKNDFVAVLEKRSEDLSGAGLARVKKVIKQANAIA